MKKRLNCIIDFGQTHLKFNLITENYLVTRTLVYKNRLTILKNNLLYYDSKKIKKKIIYHLNKLLRNYKIDKVSYISHGSVCFFFDKSHNINNGFHFSKKTTYSENKLFEKSKPKFLETFTPDYKNLHNLGKNFFIINLKNKVSKFITLNSFLGYLFSKKNITDRSYIGCHSYLWNFRKKKYSSLVNNILSVKKMPTLKKSGIYIGDLDTNISESKYRSKIYNGGHDTSAAFYFHSIFFKKKSFFLSTGTTFVFGKLLNKIKIIEQKHNFYYLNSLNDKDIFLTTRFMGGSFYKQLCKKKSISNSMKLLANFTYRELLNYSNIFTMSKFNLVIDGPFSQNKKFIFELKKQNNNMIIYTAKNKQTPSLGMLYACNNSKVDLPINKFYNKF